MVEQISLDRAKALYGYLRELSALRTKAVTDISEYPWKLYVRELLTDPDYIEVTYRDRTEDEVEERDPVLVRVQKPEFQKCPEPFRSLELWLMPGWDDYRQEVTIIRERVIDRDKDIREDFEADPARVRLYNDWLEKRNEWQKKQKRIAKTRNLFGSLYQTYIDLGRDVETMELIVADGFLVDAENGTINHPIVTKRVGIRFDARDNALFIEDLDVDTELYTLILQRLDDVDLGFVAKANEELKQNDYHPLDRNDLPDYLKAFIHKLSSDSLFSGEGKPDGWNEKNRFLMYSDPVFIFRKRVDGTPRFLQGVIESIDETGWLPLPIEETVSGGKIEVPDDTHEQTIEEQLAAVGGEDVDILLSKEANREQLEIAQRINLYNAVLVQGPPGTGKTHTIANLLGHFLAQGQSVLVTSQTPKALQVLKDKVSDNIKPLCVSVLNDSNMDMERSVDGITSFMSRYTSNELRKEAEVLKSDRQKVISDLADVRKKIYAVINAETNNIVLNGEEISPSKAADFVLSNEERLSYIPGKVKLYMPLPLSYQELIDLYRSNENLDASEEKELECGLPSAEELTDPEIFEQMVADYASYTQKLQKLASEKGWSIQYHKTKGTVIDLGRGDIIVPISEKQKLAEVLDYIENFGTMEEWMKYAAVDGHKGGAYAKRWETLIEQLENTSRYSESLVEERFGKVIEYDDEVALITNEEMFVKLSELLEKRGKVTKLDFFMNKALQPAYEMVKINGERLSSKADVDIVLHQINLARMRRQCASYWNELMKKAGEPAFSDLDADEPENIAKAWIEPIRRNLAWYKDTFTELADKLESVGVQTSEFIAVNRSDNAMQMTEKILDAISSVIPDVLQASKISRELSEMQESFTQMKQILRAEKRTASAVCSNLAAAIDALNPEDYNKWYKELDTLYDKYYLQSSRRGFIDRISEVAPDWAEAIRGRVGRHGESVLPADIEDAWRWKQYSGIISEILSTPYDTLQAESLSLSRSYRRLTGEYAEKMAWYHLLQRTENDIDMRQALNGWKLTVRKIGKGTGKSAPKLKAQARELMAKCQNAVPAWIMPMNRVIESLDPKENRFDVVIVDEASQSDVTALGVMYLAKKVIIVGDDKQVSPMAIGTDQGRMDALESMYIKDKIPNSHLYGATTSLYDIAATTYQPLMLREHFRCVPEIIGFSNMLSYDYKIKPLRDAGSSILLPAVVNYRVKDGRRVRKQNDAEARTIVALIKACIDRPEYRGKSIGVISLLGDEQAKIINKLIFKYIGPQEIEQRRILCGNPSHFQGDERDVVFLSVVDSNEDDGPLARQEFGPGEAYRKRFNVAASRAKDQLWVVDSLDSANDLKPGDIRKRLIEYSKDPKAFEEQRSEIEAKAESPFEASVVSALAGKGYRLAQQWKVGAYRLDIVAISGNRHIAIECDGERFHSGEAKIREDMERQTILERAGWRFIRIRGSEYYRDPDGTIGRVVNELRILGIEPEMQLEVDERSSSELLDSIKRGAAEYLAEFEEDETAEKEEPELEKEPVKRFTFEQQILKLEV